MAHYTSGGNRIAAHNLGKPLRNAEFSCGHLHCWKGPENCKQLKQANKKTHKKTLKCPTTK